MTSSGLRQAKVRWRALIRNTFPQEVHVCRVCQGRASEVSVLHSKLGQGVRVTRLLSAGDSNLHDI